MKKIFALIMFVFIGLAANAQNWNHTHIDGDELKGTPENEVYVFVDENENGFVFGANEMFFKVITKSGFFNYNKYNIVSGIIGLYDENNNLLKKYDQFMFRVDNGLENTAYPNKYSKKGGNNKKNVKEIFNHLLNVNGYIRIIIPRYGDSDFDMKINCITTIKEDIKWLSK